MLNKFRAIDTKRFSRSFLKVHDMVKSIPTLINEKITFDTLNNDGTRQFRWVFFSEWSSVLFKPSASRSKFLLTRSFNSKTRGWSHLFGKFALTCHEVMPSLYLSNFSSVGSLFRVFNYGFNTNSYSNRAFFSSRLSKSFADVATPTRFSLLSFQRRLRVDFLNTSLLDSSQFFHTEVSSSSLSSFYLNQTLLKRFFLRDFFSFGIFFSSSYKLQSSLFESARVVNFVQSAFYDISINLFSYRRFQCFGFSGKGALFLGNIFPFYDFSCMAMRVGSFSSFLKTNLLYKKGGGYLLVRLNFYGIPSCNRLALLHNSFILARVLCRNLVTVSICALEVKQFIFTRCSNLLIKRIFEFTRVNSNIRFISRLLHLVKINCLTSKAHILTVTRFLHNTLAKIKELCNNANLLVCINFVRYAISFDTVTAEIRLKLRYRFAYLVLRYQSVFVVPEYLSLNIFKYFADLSFLKRACSFFFQQQPSFFVFLNYNFAFLFQLVPYGDVSLSILQNLLEPVTLCYIWSGKYQLFYQNIFYMKDLMFYKTMHFAFKYSCSWWPEFFALNFDYLPIYSNFLGVLPISLRVTVYSFRSYAAWFFLQFSGFLFKIFNTLVGLLDFFFEFALSRFILSEFTLMFFTGGVGALFLANGFNLQLIGLRCFSFVKFLFNGTFYFDLALSINRRRAVRPKFNSLKFDLLGRKTYKGGGVVPVTSEYTSVPVPNFCGWHSCEINYRRISADLLDFLTSPRPVFTFLLNKFLLDNFFQSFTTFCSDFLIKYKHLFYWRYVLRNSSVYNNLLLDFAFLEKKQTMLRFSPDIITKNVPLFLDRFSTLKYLGTSPGLSLNSTILPLSLLNNNNYFNATLSLPFQAFLPAFGNLGCYAEPVNSNLRMRLDGGYSVMSSTISAFLRTGFTFTHKQFFLFSSHRESVACRRYFNSLIFQERLSYKKEESFSDGGGVKSRETLFFNFDGFAFDNISSNFFKLNSLNGVLNYSPLDVLFKFPTYHNFDFMSEFENTNSNFFNFLQLDLISADLNNIYGSNCLTRATCIFAGYSTPILKFYSILYGSLFSTYENTAIVVFYVKRRESASLTLTTKIEDPFFCGKLTESFYLFHNYSRTLSSIIPTSITNDICFSKVYQKLVYSEQIYVMCL